MRESAVQEAFNGKSIEQLVDYLVKETFDRVQINGVPHMIELMEKVIAEQFEGRKAPAFARGIFLITMELAVKSLYTIPGHKLIVTHGIDRKGTWLFATCSSGAYALWRSSPERSILENWDRVDVTCDNEQLEMPSASSITKEG